MYWYIRHARANLQDAPTALSDYIATSQSLVCASQHMRTVTCAEEAILVDCASAPNALVLFEGVQNTHN